MDIHTVAIDKIPAITAIGIINKMANTNPAESFPSKILKAIENKIRHGTPILVIKCKKYAYFMYLFFWIIIVSPIQYHS